MGFFKEHICPWSTVEDTFRKFGSKALGGGQVLLA
eukprot:CAMPEP_0206506120 /NCGR_PEP_ID=MMETSP0324_2-20121206/56564_1 /ASSEMBLY_ACC=CAM_ASM_000836 /TAXON_ID=2866 /ORGANISM="Crypthecodinium cohnii, Strain Seligo" /LENGTH=34 /DNA_ID= /DNA_START= /DNA_END= /DNA_ORIENTATION=